MACCMPYGRRADMWMHAMQDKDHAADVQHNMPRRQPRSTRSLSLLRLPFLTLVQTL